MNGDEELARKLAVLRAAYIAESPARIAELWTAFARVQNGDLLALETLAGLLHRLAGSGGAYGLMRVTEEARAGEHVAHRIHESGRAPASNELSDLRLRIQNLAEAFASAANPE